MPDYLLTARSVKADKTFGDDVDETRFLIVPDVLNGPNGPVPVDTPTLAFEASDKRDWAKAVIAEAGIGDDGQGLQRGDVLVFVHGYNNTPANVLSRHRVLLKNLRGRGYSGTVVSFDWPSGDVALAYLIDRHKAKETAMRLVTDCISLLATFQSENCQVNVHLLAHSTGAFVIRETCDDADDSAVKGLGWNVSQVVFISGDVSSDSMSEGNPTSESLYRHCIRLTNYSNGHDSVLALSSAKRLGVAPRAGRVGLPDDAPASAVNVDCSAYFETIDPATPCDGALSHSWQFNDLLFAQDLLTTIQGDVDRNLFATRAAVGGKLVLVKP